MPDIFLKSGNFGEKFVDHLWAYEQNIDLVVGEMKRICRNMEKWEIFNGETVDLMLIVHFMDKVLIIFMESVDFLNKFPTNSQLIPQIFSVPHMYTSTPVCIVRFSSVDPNAKVMSVAIGWYERPRQENEELCNTYVDILYVRST